MNINETFNNLRYHHEDEVVEFFANKAAKPSARRRRTTLTLMIWLFVLDGLTKGSFKLTNRYIIFLWF